MDRLPNIEMKAPEELKEMAEDLAIINEADLINAPKEQIEDLKADPFIRAEPIRPPEPKPKRKVSDKQKAHLANARKLARERKAEAKRQKEEEVKSTPIKLEPIHEEPPINNEEQQFTKWLDHMDKFSRIQSAVEKQRQKEQEEKERKEKELEEKYFKKFQAQQKNIKTEVSEPLIEKQEETYGNYSNYF